MLIISSFVFQYECVLRYLIFFINMKNFNFQVKYYIRMN